MDIFLFGHGAMEGRAHHSFQTHLTMDFRHGCGRCIIFTTDTRDVQPLVSETKRWLGPKGCTLTPILCNLSTHEANSRGDVEAQPWQVLRELVKQVDDAHDTTLLCGRHNACTTICCGWLQYLPKTTLLNIDSAEPPLSPSLEELGGDVSPETIAGMPLATLRTCTTVKR